MSRCSFCFWNTENHPDFWALLFLWWMLMLVCSFTLLTLSSTSLVEQKTWMVLWRPERIRLDQQWRRTNAEIWKVQKRAPYSCTGTAHRCAKTENPDMKSVFFSLSKQSLVELLQSNLCLYALFRSSAASAPDSSALFKISGCSVPADCPPLECDTCISNRLCSDNESRYLHDKNQTFEKVSYQKSEPGAIWQTSISNATIRRTSQLLLCI